MKTIDKIRGIALPLTLLVLATTARAANPPEPVQERDKLATQVAKAWISSWMSGETGVTTSLSAVPFDVDGKMEIKALPEVKAIFDKFSEKEGKLDLKVIETKIVSSTAEKVVVMVTYEDDDGGSDTEDIAVSLQPGEAFRVIGFKD